MIPAIKQAQDRLSEAKRQLLNAQCDHKVDRGDTARFRVQAALGVVHRLDMELSNRIAWEKWGKANGKKTETKLKKD
tara:strand:+ start:1362 stop:1592 length:231 start_codon:yes stop_codon:yes gene_type:complete